MKLIYDKEIKYLEKKVDKCKNAIITLDNSDFVGKVSNSQRMAIRLNKFEQRKKVFEDLLKPIKVTLAI